MLFVFSGKDTVGARQKAHSFLEGKHNVVPEVLEAGHAKEGLLSELAGTHSLFGGNEAYLVDMWCEDSVSCSALLSSLEVLAESEHVFVVVEGALKADHKKAFKKHASQFEEFNTIESEERFNTFSLADAFARRDKKSLWVLLQRAILHGVSSEEMIGVLFWQIKSIALAHQTNSAEEAGMKAYPYKKAQAATKKFNKEDTNKISHNLLELYHHGHEGVRDIDLALERFVLNL